jgi:Pyridoxamine 5'-phosphate oxidase
VTDHHSEIAQRLLDTNLYMTLSTADADGRPWASPVLFAALSPAELLWVSTVEARHSRNIAARPEIAIVVFDSTESPGVGQALYMEATAAEVAEAERDRGVTEVSRAGPGAPQWTAEDVRAPAAHRLYAASVQRWWVLGEDDEEEERIEVKLRGSRA